MAVFPNVDSELSLTPEFLMALSLSELQGWSKFAIVVLIVDPPGTRNTMLARAVARMLEFCFPVPGQLDGLLVENFDIHKMDCSKPSLSWTYNWFLAALLIVTSKMPR